MDAPKRGIPRDARSGYTARPLRDHARFPSRIGQLSRRDESPPHLLEDGSPQARSPANGRAWIAVRVRIEPQEEYTLKRSIWIALLAALVGSASPALAQRLDGIAAHVNGEVILESDLEEQLALFLMRAQVPVKDSSIVDTMRTQILNELINEKLIVAEAKRQGLTVSDAEVSRQVEQAITDAKQRMGGEQGFNQQLAREGITEDQLRTKYQTELRRQLLAQRLVQKQLPRKTVTAAEAEAYFKANHDKFPKVPAELRLQVIQIPAMADSATDAEARKKALDVRKRLLGGEKFAKVSAEVSEDPASARSGGDLGFFSRGEMEPAVENAAFKLAPGTLSEPVRSSYGWHIVETIEFDSLKTRGGKDSLDAAGRRVVEVHARHILVRVPIDEDDAQRANDLAVRVRAEAAEGGDFGALARRYSKYDGQQGEDGDIGFVSLGALQPNIRGGLDSLAVGQVSEVLVNQIGFNIFKVLDKRPEREYQLEEIRKDLPELVGQMKQRERYDEWVKSLRTKAHVKINTS